GRLISDARVVSAIGQAGDRLTAAKEEIGMAWIADRPAAGLLVELEQRAALADGDDVVDQLRFQLDIELVGLGERGVAPYRRPRDPQHMPMGARLARARGGGGWRLGAARQPEPVHLADHRIAGNAAKLRGDLARRQPIRPEFLQRFDALIGPGHALNSSPVAAAEEVQTESHSGLGQRPVGPTHTRATDLRYDLSAARSVVFDDGKATIWREAGAKGRAACLPIFFPKLPHASTPIFQPFQCLYRFAAPPPP